MEVVNESGFMVMEPTKRNRFIFPDKHADRKQDDMDWCPGRAAATGGFDQRVTRPPSVLIKTFEFMGGKFSNEPNVDADHDFLIFRISAVSFDSP